MSTVAGAKVGNFPFTTIDPNVGVVDVPDERLNKLADLTHPKKITPAAVQFVDIAGIVKGAHQGEGLGNKFLAQIREVDAISIVIRAFNDPAIIHVNGTIDPTADLGIILSELLLADLDSLERQIRGFENKLKSGEKDAAEKIRLGKAVFTDLSEERVPDLSALNDDERKIVKAFNLLTTKPFIVTLNVAENEIADWNEISRPNGTRNDNPSDASSRAKREISSAFETLKTSVEKLITNAPIVAISARIESELADLDTDEQQAFLAELGLKESGLTRLVHTAFATLGLITYLTAGPDEVRAWTIHKGDTAPQAAGVIHGDFERGFIAAETLNYDDFINCGGWNEAKAKGLVRTEGKTYVVKDGDVMLFRFNV